MAEKKHKLTNQEKLTKRKYKKTWLPFYLVYYVANKLIIQRNMHVTKLPGDKLPKKGPAIIIYNHLSRVDHSLFMDAAWPRRINILAGYNEFFRSHLRWAFKHNNVIPKKVYSQDIISIKAMKQILKDKKGVIAFSPEGTSSIHGNGQPAVPGTGHLLKHYGVPVYFLNIAGSYLYQNKVDNGFREGRIETKLELMFTEEQLKELSVSEIDDRVNEKMRHDDYEWQKEKHIEWKPAKGVSMTNNLSDILYRCPKCGSLFTMVDHDDLIECTNCGNGAKMNHFYEFEPFEGAKIFDTPTKWVDWERMEIIKEIRKNKDFSFSFDAVLGMIPEYEWLKDYKTSYPVGHTKVTLDHNGIHFDGDKNGEPWKCDLNYKEVYTLAINTDLKQFDIYIDGVPHEFTPKDSRIVDYCIHLVQEMNRLHFNTFKNFKWNEYMYENVDENN